MVNCKDRSSLFFLVYSTYECLLNDRLFHQGYYVKNVIFFPWCEGVAIAVS